MKKRTWVTIIFLTGLILYSLVVYWWMIPAPKAYRAPEWTPAEKRQVVKRMKFHGIESCIWTPAEGYYFIRDGKVCKL